MSASSEVTETPDGIDTAAVTAWITEHTHSRFTGPLQFDKLPGGHSNFTYKVLDATGGSFVLRRPPLGELLPSAHDMAREYTIISALWPTPVPVPEPIAFCEDPAITGARFYCMGLVDGKSLYEAADVQAMIGKLFTGRVVYHDGTAQIAPGISVHRVGGHTRGLQVVRVHTRRGWVVLAADAAHFYANWRQRRPFPIVDSVPDYLDAFGIIESLASSPQHVIPGHDPLVLASYPPAAPGLANAVRVDLPPLRPVP